MNDPLYAALDRMQVNSGYDSDEPAITDFVEDTPMSEVYQDDGRQILPDSDWEMDMINASDEIEQSGRHGQPVTSAPASVERLEDLASELQADMIALVANPYLKFVRNETGEKLLAAELIFYDKKDSLKYLPTKRGRDLVADYQQRQASDEHQQERGVDKAEMLHRANEQLRKDVHSLASVMRENVNLRTEKQVLEADMETLRSELAAAKAEVNQYRELLNAALQFAPRSEPQIWKSNENHMYADSLYTLGLAIRKILDASK